MKLINLDNGQILTTHTITATTFYQRLKGLMFTKSLPLDWGLLIRPCHGIHTFFMKYNIDALHLDSNQLVVAIEENMMPGRIGKTHPHTVEVVELAPGKIKQTDTQIGHTVKFVDESI